MPSYKPVDRSPRLLPVVLSEQIQPGTFEFALDHLVDHELNLDALDARFNNDETVASAYTRLSNRTSRHAQPTCVRAPSRQTWPRAWGAGEQVEIGRLTAFHRGKADAKPVK